MDTFTIVSAIAAGKTEILKHVIKMKKNYSIVGDSLEIIMNIENENFLDYYYKDLNRWALTSQILFFIARLMKYTKIKNESNNDVLLMEGDWLSSKECFGNILKIKNHINKTESEIYDIFYSMFPDKPKISGYIFLDCSIETHMKRLRKRNRKGEEEITEKFMRDLKNQDRILINYCSENNIPHIVIDCDWDYEKDSEKAQEAINEVINFIENHRTIYKN